MFFVITNMFPNILPKGLLWLALELKILAFSGTGLGHLSSKYILLFPIIFAYIWPESGLIILNMVLTLSMACMEDIVLNKYEIIARFLKIFPENHQISPIFPFRD